MPLWPIVCAQLHVCFTNKQVIHSFLLAKSLSSNSLIPKQSADYYATRCALHPVLLFGLLLCVKPFIGVQYVLHNFCLYVMCETFHWGLICDGIM